jgi:hypothetical protein
LSRPVFPIHLLTLNIFHPPGQHSKPDSHLLSQLIKGIPPDELRVLEDFGRKRETGLGSFLNFANRVVHDYKDECTLEQWQTRIRSELHRGRNTGQIDKSPGRPLSWAGLGEIAPLALGSAPPVSQEELLAVKAEQIEELGPPSGL